MVVILPCQLLNFQQTEFPHPGFTKVWPLVEYRVIGYQAEAMASSFEDMQFNRHILFAARHVKETLFSGRTPLSSLHATKSMGEPCKMGQVVRLIY